MPFIEDENGLAIYFTRDPHHRIAEWGLVNRFYRLGTINLSASRHDDRFCIGSP